VAFSNRLAINLTPRYVTSLRKASASLQKLAYGEVRTLASRFEADQATFIRAYDRVAALPGAVVLELKLGGGARLLAAFREGTATLLDVGGHEIVGRYRPEWLSEQLARATPAGGEYVTFEPELSRLFRQVPDERVIRYANEVDPGWVYFLADDQAEIAAQIVDSIRASSLDDPAFHLVVGGPGTGKTVVLAKLLVELSASGVDAGLVASDRPLLGLRRHRDSQGACQPGCRDKRIARGSVQRSARR
jgi:hypothetical protein